MKTKTETKASEFRIGTSPDWKLWDTSGYLFKDIWFLSL